MLYFIRRVQSLRTVLLQALRPSGLFNLWLQLSHPFFESKMGNWIYVQPLEKHTAVLTLYLQNRVSQNSWMFLNHSLGRSNNERKKTKMKTEKWDFGVIKDSINVKSLKCFKTFFIILT